MKLLHHVKKHGKTITLHLKKHHKKYIFGILSATLLWKGIGLIATYAVIHHVSFSFADIILGGDDNTIIETEITNENESINTDEEVNKNTNENEEETEIEESTTEDENTNEEIVAEGDLAEEEVLDDEESDNNETNNTEEENENTQDTETIVEENDEKSGNGICDYGDINITSPAPRDTVGKTFDILREFTNNDCENNEYIIKLRDSNDQYLDIFSGNKNTTGFSFDSTQLISSFYNITGLNNSGEEIIVQTGQYEGIGTNYYTGHKLAIISDEGDTIYRKDEGGEFTIDNKKPEISNIKVEYSTKNNKVNIGDTITITFESDEKLENSKVNILGQYALLEENNGRKYKYSMDFSEKNTLGKIVYGIEYQDKIGNTGYIEGHESKELDYTKPTITNLIFSLMGDGKVKVAFDTNKNTDINFIYQISGTNITNSINSNGLNQHKITLDDIKKSYKYNFSISVQDDARNTIYIGGNFYISGNEINFTNQEINKSQLLTDFGFTGNKETDIKIITNNFSICANEVTKKPLKLAINKQKSTIVYIPEFNNENTKKMSNAFIAVLFERVENKKLPQYAIDEITQDLNNFLIVVKLVKDDNNECKQNMTQYYINKFKKTLIKYGLINNQ